VLSSTARVRDPAKVFRVLTELRAWQLFAVALLLRLPMIWLRHPDPIHTEDVKAGLTLAKLGYLGDPFAIPTGVTAHVPPAYPALIAALRMVSPSDASCMLLLSVAFALVTSLNIALLPWAERSLRLPRGAGTVAALLLLVPVYAWIELSPEHETPLIVLALLLVMGLTSRTITGREPSARAGAELGAVVGLAAYVTPTVLPVAVFSAAASWQTRDWDPRRILTACATAALTFLLAIAPYTLRNHHALGQWFFMRDDFGIELAMSYGPQAHATMDENSTPEGTLANHPSASVEQAAVLRSMGEVNYNHMLLRGTLQWIEANPGATLALVAERALYLVLPYAKRWYQSALAGAISLAALAGVVLWWRSSYRVGVQTVACALIGYLFIYLLLEHDIRYMYPALVLESLLAGCTAVALWRLRFERLAADDAQGEAFSAPD
jgi:hypothetical protein